MGTLVTLLFVLHCYFVSTGQTTYEFLQGAWKKRPNPFNKGLRANWIAVVRDAAMHRSKCDGTPTIETRSTSGLGEYVGTKIVSPREDDKTIGIPMETPGPPKLADPPKGPAEFQVHLGEQVISTHLSEKMLKKSLQKALIDPFVKQFKQKIEKVMVDGELADVTRPASAFVTHAGRAVSVQLVRPGDPV